MDDRNCLADWCQIVKNGWSSNAKDLPTPRVVNQVGIILGVSLGLSIITYLSLTVKLPILVASFGASACLLFCVPKAPVSQPRSVIGGHMISAAIGVACQIILGCTWYSAVLSVCGATAAMLYSRTLHPPAAATALIAVLTVQDIMFPIYPVGVGASILIAAKTVANQLISKLAQVAGADKKGVHPELRVLEEVPERLHTVIDDNVCPATFPVAIKLIVDHCLPQAGKWAGDIFGSSPRICQAVSAARFHGGTIVFPLEDHTCPIPMLACPILRLVEQSESFLSKEESGERIRLKKLNGILITPLHKAEFEPDLVVIFGNPGQMARLVQLELSGEGSDVSPNIVSVGQCGGEIIFSSAKQKYTVTIPGYNERACSVIGEEEMYFCVSGERIPDFIRSIGSDLVACATDKYWTGLD